LAEIAAAFASPDRIEKHARRAGMKHFILDHQNLYRLKTSNQKTVRRNNSYCQREFPSAEPPWSSCSFRPEPSFFPSNPESGG
jgi:hypothetical protein